MRGNWAKLPVPDACPAPPRFARRNPPRRLPAAMLNSAGSARRAIPSLDRLLQLDAVADLVSRYGRPLVTETARAELAALRAALARAQSPFDESGFVRACAA